MIHDRTPEPEERRLLHELDNAEKRIRELEAELAGLRGDSIASSRKDPRKDASELRCPKCSEWTGVLHWSIRDGTSYDGLKARAEKAEKEFEEQEKELARQYHHAETAEKRALINLEARRKAEARVAELERDLRLSVGSTQYYRKTHEREEC